MSGAYSQSPFTGPLADEIGATNWNAGSVAAVGTGLSINSGTLAAQWSGGTVAAVGAGLTIAAGNTLAAIAVTNNWNAGSVAAVGLGLTLASQTLVAQWEAGTVAAIGAGLTLTAGNTLAAIAASMQWNAGSVSAIGANLSISGGTLTAVAPAAITSGTIDNTVIGGTTPVAGSFTNLSASGTVSGAGVVALLSPYTQNASAAITGGTVNGTTVGATTPASGAFTSLSASGTVSGAGFVALHASPGPIGSVTPSTGAFTTLSASGTVSGAGFTALVAPYAPLASPTFTGSVTIPGGTINGTSIGATTPSTGAFTSLTASGTLSGTAFSNYFLSPPPIGAIAPSTGAFTTLSATSTVSGAGFTNLLAPYAPLASPTFTGSVTIPGGSINNTPIGGTTPSTGAFTNLSATGTVSGAGFTALVAGFAPIASPTFTGTVTIPAGVINAASIGATTPSTGAFTNLSVSGTLSGSGFTSLVAPYAPLAGATFTGAVVIPSGTINAASVGATTPSTGAFTNLSASGTVSGTGFSTYLASPPAIGGTTPAAGAFTTISATGTVSGSGFSTYLASPPAIGGTTANAGTFTNLTASGTVSGAGFTALLGGYAPLASPTFTGTPLAPTAAVSTNTTQIATTAFVLGQAATVAPLIDGTAAVGTSLLYARQDHVHPTDTSRAPLASPTFTGTVTIPGGAINNTTIGATTPTSGAFTTLSASSSVSGVGFSAYLASPPAIGGTTPAAGSFTTLVSTGGATIGPWLNIGPTGHYFTSNLAFNGTNWVYVTSDYGWTLNAQGATGVEFFTAASGTTGATATLIPAWTVLPSGAMTVNTSLTSSGTTTLTGAVSGAGINSLFASPPPIGVTTANVGTFTTLTSANAAITGGNINGTTIGATTSAPGTFNFITVSSLSGSAGSINGVTVGNVTPAAGSFTTLNTTGVEVINVNASSSAGASPPTGTDLQVIGLDSSITRITVDAFAAASVLTFRRADGTGAAPSALASDDTIGAINGHGYGTSAYSSTSRVTITLAAAAAWTNTSQPTYITWSTTPASSVTVAERMRLQSTGHLCIGQTTDDGVHALQVTGSGEFSGGIDTTAIGATNPSSGAFTTLTANNTVTLAPVTANVGRNILHNPLFNIAQRGTGPFTTASVYTADRWILSLANDTDSITVASLTDTDRSQIGNEYAENGLQCVVAGVSTGLTQILQYVEDTRRTSNKTVVLSFYAKGSAALSVGAYMQQNFGSGGSPSGQVVFGTQSVAITTSWARYSMTFTVPSIAGKTFGTTPNTSSLLLGIGLSAGAAASPTLGVGVQSGTFTFWGMQLEVGPVASPLETKEIGQDLKLCQRFYQTFPTLQIYTSNGLASGAMIQDFIFPVTMRIAPTGTLSAASYGNASAATVNATTVSEARIQISVTANGAAFGSFTAAFSADF